MADTNFLSIITTTTERVRELPIKDGQLVFARDEVRGFHRIALDRGGKRIFYNQITVLESEHERNELTSPTAGYYFVLRSASLWSYFDDEWIKLTKEPDEFVFIGVELPELGQEKTIYIDSDEQEISIWDEETDRYIKVSNYTKEISDSDIESLFN